DRHVQPRGPPRTPRPRTWPLKAHVGSPRARLTRKRLPGHRGYQADCQPPPRLRTQKPWFSSPLEPSRVLQTRPTLCLIRAAWGAAVAHLKVEEAVTVTVSMRVMSAGDGYKYLLRTVAAADGDRSLSTPLTR